MASLSRQRKCAVVRRVWCTSVQDGGVALGDRNAGALEEVALRLACLALQASTSLTTAAQSPSSSIRLADPFLAVVLASASSTAAVVEMRAALRAGLGAADVFGDAADLLRDAGPSGFGEVTASFFALTLGVGTETAPVAGDFDLGAGDFDLGKGLATLGSADRFGDSALVARGPRRIFCTSATDSSSESPSAYSMSRYEPRSFFTVPINSSATPASFRNFFCTRRPINSATIRVMKFKFRV